MSLAAEMHHRFQGRIDAYGGDEGKAVYLKMIRDDPNWRWENIMMLHLEGKVPIGVYPIRHIIQDEEFWNMMTDQQKLDNMVVKWGCCDIDTGNWDEAYTLANALRKMGLVPHVERSRSKGWHIWIFVEDWIPAYVMRRCLKVAYKAIDLAAKEANPKSEVLRPSQLGNYVRLPFNGAADRGRQCMMNGWNHEDDGVPFIPAYWLSHDYVSDRKQIEHWASKWFEPPRTKIPQLTDISSEQVDAIVASLPPNLRKIYTDGPKSGDTSQGLMALAHNMAQKGFSMEDTMAVLEFADLRWGKFHERQNAELYFEDYVSRAFR